MVTMRKCSDYWENYNKLSVAYYRYRAVTQYRDTTTALCATTKDACVVADCDAV